MIRILLAGGLLVAAAVLGATALRAHRRAEWFRYGCIMQEGRPEWGQRVGGRFTPEGEALRQQAARLGWIAALSLAAGLLLLAL